MSLLDVARQVVGALRIRNGGTGNAYGWGSGVVAQANNYETTSMPLGSVVYWFKAGGVKLSPSAAYASVGGVVVGHYVGGDINNLVVEAVPAGGSAAVMTQGICRVLTSADVTFANFATTGATAGQAVDTATVAAGCFGQYVQNGAFATRPLVWVRLFGTAAGGGGGGGGSFGTPAFGFGTSGAAGSSGLGVQTDATVALFDGTSPTTSAVGDSAATGSAGKAARRDHVHGREAFGAVTAQTSFGLSSANGSAATEARSDHVHGTPARPASVEGYFLTPTNGAKTRVIRVPYACTITGWTIIGDAAGTATFDVWYQAVLASTPPTVANTITAADKPSVAAAKTAVSAHLTGWTTSLAAGGLLIIEIDSTSGFGELQLVLAVSAT